MTEQTSPQRRGEALGGLVALAAVVLLVVGAVTALDSCKKDDTQTDAADAGNLDVPFGGCGDADPNEFAVQAPHDPCSQPTWVPVSCSSWRRKSLSNRRGSTVRSVSIPLMVRLMVCMGCSIW